MSGSDAIHRLLCAMSEAQAARARVEITRRYLAELVGPVDPRQLDEARRLLARREKAYADARDVLRHALRSALVDLGVLG